MPDALRRARDKRRCRTTPAARVFYLFRKKQQRCQRDAAMPQEAAISLRAARQPPFDAAFYRHARSMLLARHDAQRTRPPAQRCA